MSATLKQRKVLRVGAALAAATLVAGCGSSANRSGDDRSAAVSPRQALIQSLEREYDAAFYRPYATLGEMLPNTRHQIVGQANSVTVFETVVVGRIADVSNGVGYIEKTGPSEEGQVGGGPVKTNFGSPLADWRTLQVTVRVDRRIAGEAADQFVVAWPLMGSSANGDDAAGVKAGLRELGTVVLFLDQSKAPTAPSGLNLLDRVYGIGVVETNGRLTFPFVESEKVAPFMNGIATVDALANESGKPERTKAAG